MNAIYNISRQMQTYFDIISDPDQKGRTRFWKSYSDLWGQKSPDPDPHPIFPPSEAVNAKCVVCKKKNILNSFRHLKLFDG